MKRIRRILLPVIAGLCFAGALAAQDFDLKALDRLGANATSTANVTLNSTLLKMGAAFLGNEGDSESEALKSMIGKLKAVYVRAYKFDRPGQYSESDLAPLRAMLSSQKWTAVVDARERDQTSQVYFLMAENGKLGGVTVIATEPRKVTVVYIDGELDPGDIARLSGNMGIPDIQHLEDAAKGDNKNRK
jgi:hypothetical protein